MSFEKHMNDLEENGVKMEKRRYIIAKSYYEIGYSEGRIDGNEKFKEEAKSILKQMVGSKRRFENGNRRYSK